MAFAPLHHLPVQTEMQATRFKWRFQRLALDETGAWRVEVRNWMEVLLEMSHADVIWLHQYLATELVLDVFNAAGQDQCLLLTSLGYEPLSPVFWRQVPRRRKLAFVEISNYACSRVPMPQAPRVGIKAAIWKRELAEPSHAAPRDRKAFCGIGRVLPHKGFETAITALPEGCSLSIAGDAAHDPAYTEMLRALPARGTVNWLGQIDDRQKSRLLSDSAALIACSTHVLYNGIRVEQPELLGLVLLEAVNAGCLPLCTRIPSFNEVMADLHLTEWQFDERNSDELQGLLRRVGEAPQEVVESQLKKAGAHMREHYLWDDYWPRVQAALPNLFPA